jgi:ABC-type phosphate transport system substrate-binding protein
MVLVGGWAPAWAEMLVVQGSTTFTRQIMEPHQRAIETAAGHQLTVIPNKSVPGLMALLEGRAHMAMISAPLDHEVAKLSASAMSHPVGRLRAHEIATTRVAIAVHASNPVRKASLDMVTRVLLGELHNWQQLGGPERPIRVVLVGGGGGVTGVVESELLKSQAAQAPNIIYVKTPVQLIQIVEQEPGAIGFAQLALVNQRRATELVTDKPIQQSLTLVTLGEPTPAMQSVIDAARAVAEKTM